ncbi:efflux RND transporter periplasmic adaptor subunit [Prevotella sp. 10(H)]|uniref:efflux RND transporter periplasmic adaptor subunit n=1 Tax=Prevotella sp. 10(H) TaxID=1158294 RepID=UPI0004A78554|nr:efflux RND transporter periplasmic adaptor subunit [Prevotella sp. 10(H)]
MNVKKIVFGALALTVMVSCGNKNANPFGEQDDTPKEYPTRVLNEQNVQLETVYPVTIKGQDDTEIRPRIDGFIEAMYVDEGAVVRKGQALFKINSPNAEQAVRTAQAAVESAKAQVSTAQLNVDRFRPLAEKGIVSKVQLDTYQNTYLAAMATLAQAEAQLANARAQISWTNVSSPVDGVVGSIPYRLGSLVNNANVLTTVSSTGNVFAYFSINEKELVNMLDKLSGKTQAEKITNLPEVSLKMADGTIYEEKGKVKTITGLVNVNTGSVTLRAEFPNPHGVLRSGFSGNLSIPRNIDSTILIPQKSTFTQQNKYLVYKVQGDSVVSTLISVIPTPDGKNYVVTDGLKSGDRIVEDGIITLSNGKKIIVK